MIACPACNQTVSQSTITSGLGACGECGAFLGSPRDMNAVACAAGSMLGVVALLIMSNIVFPNLALSRAIDGVRRGDAPGMDKLRASMERRELSITGGASLGWDAEKFGDIALVSFNYLSLVEETPKRYAAWWVFEPDVGKTKVIQNAQEFIDGFLLRRGVTSTFPSGLATSPRTGPPPSR